MAVCAANDELDWPPVKEIVDKIDDLAAFLRTPDYVDLIEDERRPFKFDERQNDITFYQAFDVGTNGDGTGYIQTRFMTSDAYGINDFEASDIVLRNMAEDEDLFFVSEEDGCLCATVFKVIIEGGKFTLDKAEEKGCCQTLKIPEPGDDIPVGQHIIPQGVTGVYLKNGNPFEGQDRYDNKACRDGGNVSYKFVSTEAESDLQTCTRKFQGYFTWMARADYMATMWTKIEFIAACHRNAGSDPDVWWDKYENAYRSTECSPSVVEVLGTLEHEGDINEDPGCLYEFEALAIPWDDVTCGGVECEGGPRFYCNTLLQMEELLDKMKSDIRKYSASSALGCCCDPPSLESTDSAYGESTICSPWLGNGLSYPTYPQCWVLVRTTTTICTWNERSAPGGPYNQAKSSTHIAIDTVTPSAEIVDLADVDTADCLLGVRTYSSSGATSPSNPSDYDDYECNAPTSERIYGEPPDAGDLIAKAKASAVAAGGPSDSVCSAETGNFITFFGSVTPCETGVGFVTLAKYVIVLNPPGNVLELCGGGSPSGSVSGIKYDLVRYEGAEEASRANKTITVTWDPAESDFRSSPQSYPGTDSVNFHWAVELNEDDNVGILCLKC